MHVRCEGLELSLFWIVSEWVIGHGICDKPRVRMRFWCHKPVILCCTIVRHAIGEEWGYACERLHTPNDSGYHEKSSGRCDEVYQDDELSSSFNIEPDSTLNSLLDDANDVTVLEERKQMLRKKKCKILNVIYFSYYVVYISYCVLAISYYMLYISYYVLHQYSLVLVLNWMLKKLKSVTKKLFE
jgi:hypothetical protein